MSYYSNYSKQVDKGAKSEEIFRDIAIINGHKPFLSTDKQNKRAHIDMFLLKDDKIASFDVKSVGNWGYTSELLNNYGYEGSLYGSADMMAYVSDKNILIVNRYDLIKLVESKVNGAAPITLKGQPKPYTPYTRKEKYGWKDSWIVIDVNDLLRLKHTLWNI